MFDASRPSDPPPDSEVEAPDPSVLRAESQLADLEVLRRIGMEIAKVIGERALAEPDPLSTNDAAATEPAARDPARRLAVGRDPVEAFARISRVVRLTIALERKTDDALRDLKAGVIAQCEARQAKAAARAKADAAAWSAGLVAREAEVFDLVEAAIAAEADDRETYDALHACLTERLEEDEAYEGYGDLPVDETVRRLCEDLCLSPDWSCWTGAGWSPQLRPLRPKFSPWREPRRTPRRRAASCLTPAEHRLE